MSKVYHQPPVHNFGTLGINCGIVPCMKYTMMVLMSVLFIPNLASAAAFNNSLYYGLTGNSDVSALQEFLTVQGDYTGPITGNFFSLTLEGVKHFQARNGIQPVSGYFGILSRGVANTLLQPVAPIEETSTTTIDITPKLVTRMKKTRTQSVPVEAPVTEVPAEVTPTYSLKVETSLTNGTQNRFEVTAYDNVGNRAPVEVTTNDPDLPSSFTLTYPNWFCAVPVYDGFPNQGCKSSEPATPGTYTFTFKVGDLSETREITIE